MGWFGAFKDGIGWVLGGMRCIGVVLSLTGVVHVSGKGTW